MSHTCQGDHQVCVGYAITPARTRGGANRRLLLAGVSPPMAFGDCHLNTRLTPLDRLYEGLELYEDRLIDASEVPEVRKRVPSLGFGRWTP